MTKSTTRRTFVFSLVAVCGGLLSGLGVAEAQAGCGPDITGCWPCGSWSSCCTGHKGSLRGTIKRCGNCRYECTFSGTFMKVIPFRYTVTLNVTRVESGKIYFTASRKIPLFGGEFTTTGWATATKFHANYTSPKDRGTFTMSR